jgi:hypothetical protein
MGCGVAITGFDVIEVEEDKAGQPPLLEAAGGNGLPKLQPALGKLPPLSLRLSPESEKPES